MNWLNRNLVRGCPVAKLLDPPWVLRFVFTRIFLETFARRQQDKGSQISRLLDCDKSLEFGTRSFLLRKLAYNSGQLIKNVLFFREIFNICFRAREALAIFVR